MNSEWFEKVIKEQIKTCEDVLIGKAKEYATDDDRLHNFKNAAGMMSCDPKEALAGMMAKHTISIYDMCRSDKVYPIELWNEKITDHINYLLLLKAVVEEDHWHETIGNEGEKIVKKLERMAKNSIYGLTTKAEEDHILTAEYGEVPIFDGKPVEIKEQEKSIDKVIKGLTICIDGDCTDCPYNDGCYGPCSDNLKKDATELLKEYKVILIRRSKMPLDIKKEIEETKKIIKALKICGKSAHVDEDCRECPYYIYCPHGCVEHLKEDAAKQLEFFLKLQDPMGLNKEEQDANT